MYISERLLRGILINFKGGLIISTPDIALEQYGNKLQIRIDRNNDFYYKNERAEKVVRLEYKKLIESFGSVSTKDINTIENKIRFFLKMCYSQDLIRSRNNMEAIYCNKNAGGPRFVSGLPGL